MPQQRLTSFGLGLVIGAVVAGGIVLLLAPRSGNDTRAYIRRRLRQLTRQVDGHPADNDGQVKLYSEED